MSMYGELRISVDCNGETKTKQADKNRCDINNIIKKYARTGMITHLNTNPPLYMNVEDIPDYQGCLEKVRAADNLFKSLSAEVRKKFNNDPQELLTFIADEDNKAEAIELGLLPADPVIVPSDDGGKNPHSTTPPPP